MEYINSTIINKFRGLVSYLTKTKEEFEMIADEIEDCNLKTAFNGLSAESSQYANELTTHLRTLGVLSEFPFSISTSTIPVPATEATALPEKGDEVLLLCSSSEHSITKAYHEILNDYFPFPGLKEVMTYQLNALMFSFMKIRLLNLTRFS